MGKPKVTLIWINYNSKPILNIVLTSLKGVFELDYPELEVFIVDNGSNDGSFEIIKKYIDEKKNSGIPRIKVLRFDSNLGFITANNIAFRLRDKESKYIVLLNNDAEPFSQSLLDLVEILDNLEKDRVAGIQGIITTWDKKYIDNMGFIVDELLFTHALYRGESINTPKKPHLCTFISGAYSIYNIKYLISINGDEKIFDEPFFAYYDDKILGLKAWNKNFKLISYPIIAARHYGSASFKRVSTFKLYLTTRNFLTTLNRIKNHRYKPLVKIFYIARRIIESTIYSTPSNILSSYKSIIRGLIDSRRYAVNYLDYELDLTKILVKRLSITDALTIALTPLGD